MRCSFRQLWNVVPVLAVVIVLLCWLASYFYLIELEMHGSGPGYVYLSGGLGKVSVGRYVDDQEDRWRGFRKHIARADDGPYSSAWKNAPAFDFSYMGCAGYEAAGVWFPYWFLCLSIALWPVHRVCAAYVRRRREARGLCVCCGYDLGGWNAWCPQCGAIDGVRATRRSLPRSSATSGHNAAGCIMRKPVEAWS